MARSGQRRDRKEKKKNGYTSDEELIFRKKIKYEDVNTIIASKKLEEDKLYMVTVRRNIADMDDVRAIFLLKNGDNLKKVRMLVDMVDIPCDALCARLVASGRIKGNYHQSVECVDNEATFASMGFVYGRIDLAVGFPEIQDRFISGSGESLVRRQRCYMWGDICKVHEYQKRMRRFSHENLKLKEEQTMLMEKNKWWMNSDTHFKNLFEAVDQNKDHLRRWMQYQERYARTCSDGLLDKVSMDVFGGNARSNSDMGWRQFLRQKYFEIHGPPTRAQDRFPRCCWDCEKRNGQIQFSHGRNGDVEEANAIERDWIYHA